MLIPTDPSDITAAATDSRAGLRFFFLGGGVCAPLNPGGDLTSLAGKKRKKKAFAFSLDGVCPPSRDNFH